MKLASLLLLPQAVADTVTCVVCGIPGQILNLIILIQGYFPNHTKLLIILSTLSVIASLLIFTIIAIERCLSVCMPFWHRVNVEKKHIWVPIITAWLFSVILTSVFPTDFKEYFKHSMILALCSLRNIY